jgi:hypothetical protein
MRLAKSAQVVFTPLADGTGVLLNVDTLVYYSTNTTAAALWQQIDSGAAPTLEDLLKYTCNRYDVDEVRARHYVTDFVHRLAEYQMIRLD